MNYSKKLLFIFLTLYSVGTAVRAGSNDAFIPPNLEQLDRAGVDLVSLAPKVSIQPVSIGPADNRLSYTLKYSLVLNGQPSAGPFGAVEGGSAGRHFMGWSFMPNRPYYTVTVMGKSESFLYSNGVYTSWSGAGGILSVTGNTFQYIDRDGVKADFTTIVPSLNACHDDPYKTPPTTLTPTCAVLSKVTYPNGETLTFLGGNAITNFGMDSQPTAIIRNDGYAIHIDYRTNGPLQYETLPIQAKAVNLTVDYCNMVSSSCAFSKSWPTGTITWPANLPIWPATSPPGSTYKIVVTNAQNESTIYTHTYTAYGLGSNAVDYHPLLTGVRPSWATVDTKSYFYTFYYTCIPQDSLDTQDTYT